MEKKYDKPMTVRLPEELKNFEAMGFPSMTDYIKTALKEYNRSHNYEISKTSDILDSIGKMITSLEGVRDYDSDNFSKEQDQLLDSCYAAAKILADTDIMKNSPINEMPGFGENGEEEEGVVYKYQWALS